MKGIAGYDFIISLALFAIVYVYLFNFLPFLTTGSRQTNDVLLEESLQLSDTIVKSAGYPENWTSTSNMEYFGLCYYDKVTYERILDKEKVEAMAGVNCDELKPKTPVNLKFAVKVETSNGTYSCNAQIPSTARVIRRTAYMFDGYANSPASVTIYTWLP